MPRWKSFTTAPKDGTPVIFWLSSDTCADTTANFYDDDEQWHWEHVPAFTNFRALRKRP